MDLVRRSVPGRSAGLIRAIGRTVASLAPRQPIYQVQSLAEHARWGTRESHLMAKLLAPLGGVALLRATMGVYGVMSYLVAQRTQELGIRRALGATPDTIVGLVIREGLRPVLLGAGVGLSLAVLAAGALSRFLYGASALDPAVFGSVFLVLSGAAVAAMAVPARRATRIDPLVALRSD